MIIPKLIETYKTLKEREPYNPLLDLVIVTKGSVELLKGFFDRYYIKGDRNVAECLSRYQDDLTKLIQDKRGRHHPESRLKRFLED